MRARVGRGRDGERGIGTGALLRMPLPAMLHRIRCAGNVGSGGREGTDKEWCGGVGGLGVDLVSSVALDEDDGLCGPCV